MTEHANTSRGDVAYWQLTHAQAARYHVRLSAMYARQSKRFSDRADAEIRKAEIGLWVVGALIAVVLVINVVAAVI